MMKVSQIQLNYNTFNKVTGKKSDNYNKAYNLTYNSDSFDRMTFKGNSDKSTEKHTSNNYAGCIMGGAIGDSFGAPIEGLSTKNIAKKFGGQLRYLITKNGIANFTDDTQMTLFTADGLLNSVLKRGLKAEPDYDIVYNSYLNWHTTQINSHPSVNARGLMKNDELYVKRYPGRTCIEALKMGVKGSIENPINDSAGNGGVMRTAPVGLLYNRTPSLAFKVGAQCAALTHGNPNAYLPAGTLATMISCIIQGNSLQDSIEKSINILKTYKGHEQTLEALRKAIKLSSSEGIEADDAISEIGEGWTGHEALGIAVYSALKNQDDFKNAIITSANHSGDSDTTAAITGNIMGAYIGIDNIPRKWKNHVELQRILLQFSEELLNPTDQAPSLQEKWHADGFNFQLKNK